MDIRLQIIFFFLLPLFVKDIKGQFNFFADHFSQGHLMETAGEEIGPEDYPLHPIPEESLLNKEVTAEIMTTEDSQVFDGKVGNGYEIYTSKPILVDRFQYDFPRNKSLDIIKEAVKIFVNKANDLLNEISKDNVTFLANLDEATLTKFLRGINTGQCDGEPHYQRLKESFRLRFEFLIAPLKDAVAEFLDSVQSMERTIEMERGILGVQLVSCDFFGSGYDCGNSAVLQLPNPDGVPANGGSDSPSYPRGNSRKVLLSSGCARGFFRCRNGGCVRLHQVCDRARNCHDGSDEEHCLTSSGPRENCNLKDENFLCSDEDLCLPVKSLCDGEPDCRDNSDEGVYCNVTNGCDRCSAMGGVCLRTPAGPLCLSSCPSSFVLDLESGVCVLSDSAEGLKNLYKNFSFPGKLMKINFLFKRVSSGLFLMKKQINKDIMKTVSDLYKCKNEVFIGPFAISP